MEEIEVPLEQAQEHLHEAAHHSSQRWISWAALASGLIAVVAAVAALQAGAHANEAMMQQMKGSDAWNYYQAKSVKSSVLNSKMELLAQLGKPEQDKDTDKLAEYKTQLDETAKKAHEFEESSEHHMRVHEIFAKAVTLLQVSIALGAIAVLSKKRKFWFVSLGFACVGTGFLIAGFLA